MTTRAHLNDGTTFDIDEETEARFTHMNDQAVLRWEYIGPTPPRPARSAGETLAEQKDRLRAELKALEDLEST
jgi:hypothetical protein